MKPKTKLQKRVYELSQKLPTITIEQKAYAFKHCFKHIGYRLKSGTTCMECSTVFQSQGKRGVCPKCGTRLSIEDTRKLKGYTLTAFAMLTTQDEFQVIRFFETYQSLRKGKEAYYSILEVSQRYLTEDGRDTIIAVSCSQSGSFSWGGDLEIKNPSTNSYGYTNPLAKYVINPSAIYPQQRILPIFKRNGYKGNCHGLSPLSLFKSLLIDSKIETLLKAKQFDMLRHMYYSSWRTLKFWDSIKICMRNGYIIKDASLWCDYIELLEYYKKDIRNAKYVCPENLRKEHNILDEKKRKKLALEQRERNRLQAIRDEKQHKKDTAIFEKLKGKFFGIELSKGKLKIVVLDKIEEYIKESEMMNHCVFSSKYYNRKESLVLSARIGAERIATVEISLKTFDVIQCRSKHNKEPKEYDTIINLIKNNKRLFRKRMTTPKTA